MAWGTVEEGVVVANDGFIVRGDSGNGETASSFKDSPVKFLQVFMAKVRRNCEDIDKSHMGTILNGGLLRPSDFGEAEEETLVKMEENQ